MTSQDHIVVIGGGIAGVSAAYHLALTEKFERVLLVEAESQLAMHTTGRSAAVLTENYGAGPVRPLTSASLGFLHQPPNGLVDAPLLHKRGLLTVATAGQDYAELDKQLVAGTQAKHPIVEIDRDQAQVIAPHINFGDTHRAMWEAESHDIDVAGLHQAFVRGIHRQGGEIATSHRVDSVRPTGNGNGEASGSSTANKAWLVETSSGTVQADVVVNAAGAWGDVVAQAAGIEPVGLQPLRRTAFMAKSPFDDSSGYPFVVEVQHRWYLRPDGSQFLCSPADETPSAPCDARPEEIDIARTIEFINNNTKLEIRSVTSQWAGLRTFGPDRAMVLGPEPTRPNFVWCVGQGGTGIQTAPGAGKLLADLVTTGSPSELFSDTGLDIAGLLPDRLR